MSGLIDQIDAALARTGLSDAAASRLAAGNPSLIKNIRAGAGNVGFESLRKLAEVLNLEVYFGPRLPRGFSDPAAASGQLAQHGATGGTYAAIPWHPEAAHSVPPPLTFSRAWLDDQGFVSGSMSIVVPDMVRLPGAAAGAAVALIDTAPPRTAAPVPLAFIDRGKVCLADVSRHGPFTLIHSGQRGMPDLVLQGPESAVVRILGRVIWWGRLESPATPQS